MKKLLYTIFLISLTVLPNTLFAQDEGAFVAGANGEMYIPIGTLSQRYKNTYGGSVYFGREVSEDWTWVGKIEYFKYDKMNTDNAFVTRSVKVEGVDTKLTYPLPKLKMDLEVIGLSANASYNFINEGILRTDLELGFGVYRWIHHRGAYYDSLYADTAGSGSPVVIDRIKVPSKTESDWNGGLTLGIGVDVAFYKPLSFYASANYKIIIGELWPALALNLENVSSLQMVEVKVGLRARF
jgi:hypothetical protein